MLSSGMASARAARGSGRDRARGAVLRRERICDRRNPHGGWRAIDRLEGSTIFSRLFLSQYDYSKSILLKSAIKLSLPKQYLTFV